MNGLKVKIAITLILLIGVGMLLVDYVIIILWQNELRISELKAVKSNFEVIRKIYGKEELLLAQPRLDKYLIDQMGVSSVVVVTDKLKVVSGNSIPFNEEFVNFVNLTLKSRARKVSVLGTVWGVFFPAGKYVAVAEPIVSEKGEHLGLLVVVRSLEPIYQKIVRGQRFVFFYFIINIAVLTFIGVYRFVQLNIRPLEKLVNMADRYTGVEELSLFGSGERDEFGRLSRGINMMLRRIEENRHDLRNAIKSLQDANDKLQQSRNEMIRAEKMASIGRLAAGLAHEIGNPVAIVLGYLELLSHKEVTDEERQDFVKNSEKELSRVNILIRQLLDFARLTPGLKNKVSMHQLFMELTTMILPQPVLAGISIECRLDAKVDIVWGDQDQLWQVFLNCLMNAGDAIALSRKNIPGRIIIKTSNKIMEDNVSSTPVELLVITISDNGSGIDPECMDAIFDPFFTTKEPGKGTGLGLTVSHSIIRNHTGKIIVNCPEDEEGTQVTIELPLFDALETKECGCDVMQTFI
ncbi:MAG: ATP-binding protein [Desulfobulbaceae bacterium]|nr:ATP-binding protein [Desulfobulbaceae bacterium]